MIKKKTFSLNGLSLFLVCFSSLSFSQEQEKKNFDLSELKKLSIKALTPDDASVLRYTNLQQIEGDWQNMFGNADTPGFSPIEKMQIGQSWSSLTDILKYAQESDPISYGNRRHFDFRNLDADAGLQSLIQEALNKGIISDDDFVILSHGHFPAGLFEFAKVGFSVTANIPMGGWNEDIVRLGVSRRMVLYAKNFPHHTTGCNGIAVGLNGHRGRKDFSKGSANIDPEKIFGKPLEFADTLNSAHSGRLIVLTELTAPGQNGANELKQLDLEYLKDRDHLFDNSNVDLVTYLQALMKIGIEVKVFSGYRRSYIKPFQSLDPWRSMNPKMKNLPAPTAFPFELNFYLPRNDSLDFKPVRKTDLLPQPNKKKSKRSTNN